MNLFYVEKIKGEYAIFDANDSKHCRKSLRKKVGDIVYFTDGKGTRYEGMIEEITKNDLTAKIIKRNFEEARPFSIHIAVAPTKNMSRFESFLEKATEMGIERITPLICARSEKRHVRMERLNSIMVSAAKQSLKLRLPVIDEPVDFKSFIEKENATYKYIAYCMDDLKSVHLSDNYIQGNDVIILIGPEGDFTYDEASLAKASAYTGLSLGESRLRTETAALVACFSINFMNKY